MNGLKQRVAAAALELGFAECRIAPAREAAHADLFDAWLEAGTYGDMDWMARTPERRRDPRVVLPGAKSVIVVALNYWQSRGEREHPGRIARYALGEDYHFVIERKFKVLEAKLRELGGEEHTHRSYVDYGPVLERDFASEAGLGWNGKSTMQIHPRLGTWFFLAEIITTLELEPDAPMHDYCGTCTACITACPTVAITADRRLDALRCISYLTIENKGAIPEEFRVAMGDRIFGCDDCLDACPWNRFAAESREATFAMPEAVRTMRLRDFLALDDDGFRGLFRRSPIKRIKRDRFLRNVCVGLGNVGTADDLPALERAVREEGELVAEHAEWAIGAIRARCGVSG